VTALPPEPWSRTLRAVPESLPRLRRAVVEFATEVGAPDAVLDSLRLAVSEAVSNVIVHAYSDRDEPGDVRVTAALGEGDLCVTVSDQGSGMMPRPDSPGLGLGLPIIAQLTESLEVHRSADGGTEMRMSFPLG
jgi:serine/threonine-protein kinase RsbW